MSSRLVLCQTIAALLHAGKTPTVIARELQCAKSTVYKVKNLKEAGKDLKPTYKTSKKPSEHRQTPGSGAAEGAGGAVDVLDEAGL